MKKIIGALLLLSGLLTGCAQEEMIAIPWEVTFCDDEPEWESITSSFTDNGYVLVSEEVFSRDRTKTCYRQYFEFDMPRSEMSENFLVCYDRCMQIVSFRSERYSCIRHALGDGGEGGCR